MRPAPNLAGFAESRQALRDHFGQDVTFLIPASATYDNLDPEQGTAYDPWAPATSGGGAPTEVVKNVSVVSRPIGGSGSLGLRDATQATPIGNYSADTIALILPYDEWDDVAGATHVLWLDDRYKITEVRDDAMATVYRRKLIYLVKS
jgi:hypothetical protein